MKLFKNIALIFILAGVSSCAFLFNEKTVEVRIESNPAGADVVIDGVRYGRTPISLRLEPKDYIAVLNKEGYGTAQIKLESWQAVRENKNEGTRCLADAAGTMFVLPAFSYWSVYCRDFKQSRYNVMIPYMGPAGSLPNGDGVDGINSANSPYSGGFPREGVYSQQPYNQRPYDGNYPKRY